jgi:RNA polymerase sigma-70 factor (ECF subfamily)
MQFSWFLPKWSDWPNRAEGHLLLSATEVERQNSGFLRLKDWYYPTSTEKTASAMPEPGVQPVEIETKKVSSGLESVMVELYARSGADGFGISPAQFAALLEEVTAKALPASSPALAKVEFSRTLRLQELVLARACAAGNERAWEVFLLRYREKLYEIARQITREDSSGRELADSVYADLFGTRMREGNRVSRLSYYGGRGSLDGWLRTVLAQEFVNTYRKQRHTVSLDEESEEGTQFAAVVSEPVVPADPRLENAVDETLRSLSTEERFILASYFLDGRTLAQIAPALSVHESTISRKIEKLTTGLRKQIVKNLVGQGMSRRQAEEALRADVRDLALDIRTSLAQDSVASSFSEKRAKASEGGS